MEFLPEDPSEVGEEKDKEDAGGYEEEEEGDQKFPHES